MLTISSLQMKAFSETARQRFANKMVEHLGKFLPPFLTVAGEEALRKTVQSGMASAHRHGFTHQGPVRLYLEMMMLFGSHFDTDPQHLWAIQILTNPIPVPQMQRAEMLFGKVLEYQAQVAGPRDHYTYMAHRDIAFLTRKPLLPRMETDLTHALLQEIAQAYPQKAAYVGLEALEALIRRGIDAALALQPTSPHEIFLIIALMLLFGHGCIDDPLYPWIAQTLKAPATTDSAARAHRIEAKAVAWLEQLWTYHSRDAHS